MRWCYELAFTVAGVWWAEKVVAGFEATPTACVLAAAALTGIRALLLWTTTKPALGDLRIDEFNQARKTTFRTAVAGLATPLLLWWATAITAAAGVPARLSGWGPVLAASLVVWAVSGTAHTYLGAATRILAAPTGLASPGGARPHPVTPPRSADHW